MTGIPNRFWRELAVVLAVKALVLVLIYVAWFSSPSPATDIAGHLFVGAGPR